MRMRVEEAVVSDFVSDVDENGCSFDNKVSTAIASMQHNSCTECKVWQGIDSGEHSTGD